MRKIRGGDEVIVITGKDKGKRGRVTRVLEDRVVVEGVNIAKKHKRPDPARGIGGGILEIEMPLHISNVAFMNKTTQKPDRIGFRVLADGRKVRFTKSDGEVVD